MPSPRALGGGERSGSGAARHLNVDLELSGVVVELSSYIESAAARWGFRAFKKALVSPYSAKVNNRDSSSRGTTHYEKIVECPVVSLEGGGAAGKTDVRYGTRCYAALSQH